jgi:hypothetical protein
MPKKDGEIMPKKDGEISINKGLFSSQNFLRNNTVALFVVS